MKYKIILLSLFLLLLGCVAFTYPLYTSSFLDTNLNSVPTVYDSDVVEITNKIDLVKNSSYFITTPYKLFFHHVLKPTAIFFKDSFIAIKENYKVVFFELIHPKNITVGSVAGFLILLLGLFLSGFFKHIWHPSSFFFLLLGVVVCGVYLTYDVEFFLLNKMFPFYKFLTKEGFLWDWGRIVIEFVAGLGLKMWFPYGLDVLPQYDLLTNLFVSFFMMLHLQSFFGYISMTKDMPKAERRLTDEEIVSFFGPEVEELIKRRRIFRPRIRIHLLNDDDSPQINAAACYRWNVIITTTMYRSVKDQDLARGILAHEVGHLLHQDLLARNIASSASTLLLFVNMPILIGLIIPLSIISIIPIVGKPIHAILFKLGYMLVYYIKEATLSTSNSFISHAREFKADKFAVKSGNGMGILEFLLYVRSSYEDDPEIFGTHPATDARIARVKKMLEQKKIDTGTLFLRYQPKY